MALAYSRVDFGVLEGVRLDERQAELRRSGASRIKRSRHQKSVTPDPEDGKRYGHAIDVGAFVGPRLSWELPLYYDIAEAFRKASKELGIPLRWGGAWHRLDTTELYPGVLVYNYSQRRRSQGRSAFIDGPHFELPKTKRYPA